MSIIDCHVHLYDLDSIDNLKMICDSIGISRASIVSYPSKTTVNQNPAAFAAKERYPDRFYVFAGLDHSSYFSSGRISAPPLDEQVDRLMAIGADGLKLLENKPTTRKEIDIPVDGGYFERLFARLEETGFPVLWHVADPEEFWDPLKTPGWAKERGWGYDDSHVPKEQLYNEVENVLKRHPALKIVFAHFFFLSADLLRASAVFERFENVCFDLAPGIEMLYNLSKAPHEARDFVMRHSDRILFGTDIIAGQSVEEARARAGIIRRWLETDDEFRVPEEADFLLGPPEDGVIRGMSLPVDVLEKIYHSNFERVVGKSPKPHLPEHIRDNG